MNKRPAICNFRTDVDVTTDLVTCANVLLIAVNVNTLSDVRRLLLQGHKNIAGLIVKACAGDRQHNIKTPLFPLHLFNLSLSYIAISQPIQKAQTPIRRTFAGVVVSNLPNGVAHNFLVVHCGM